MPDAIAYKILTDDQLAQLEADGRFDGAPVDLEDGYIHLSTAAQLPGTLAKHFAGKEGLALAAIDLEALAEKVKWEPSRGGDLFPHLYAPITLDAVLAYGSLEEEADGSIKLPVAG